MLVNSFLAPFGVSPQVGLANLLTCNAHVDPMPLVSASWGAQLRCWSRMMPRYFVFGVGSMVMFGRTRGGVVS